MKRGPTSSNPAPHAANDWSGLRSLIFGGIHAKLVYVAASLGVPDVLRDGGLPTEEIARRTETHPEPLRHVLRALTADGVLRETAPDTFALTGLGLLLVDDPGGSRRYDALLVGNHVERVFGQVLEAVRTGEPAAERAFGKPYFDWLGENPEAAAVFNRAMTLGARAALPILLPLGLWAQAERVVDVGGGNGTVLSTLLQEYGHLEGVVFDLPHVEREANALLSATGVADRASFEAGSFFERVPAGADAYIAVQVLHNWTDDDAARIVRRIHEAIAPGGRLVLVEVIVPDEDPNATALTDAMSFFWLGGGERSEAAWRRVLAGGGFRVDRITRGEWVSAIEALPERAVPQGG